LPALLQLLMLVLLLSLLLWQMTPAVHLMLLVHPAAAAVSPAAATKSAPNLQVLLLLHRCQWGLPDLPFHNPSHPWLLLLLLLLCMRTLLLLLLLLCLRVSVYSLLLLLESVLQPWACSGRFFYCWLHQHCFAVPQRGCLQLHWFSELAA
jgi:hypothetical protein